MSLGKEISMHPHPVLLRMEQSMTFSICLLNLPVWMFWDTYKLCEGGSLFLLPTADSNLLWNLAV